MLALAVIFGLFVGLSLGLTGGGGSILAVPLLVYGLHVAPKEAVGVSLAAVGATALAGAVQRLWRGEVEVATGLMFAAAGMVGAPAGVWLGRRLPEPLLLLSFAALMLWVAARTWRPSSAPRPGRRPCRPTARRAAGTRRGSSAGPPAAPACWRRRAS
jgi:uncharacterized membrane protein YfcA